MESEGKIMLMKMGSSANYVLLSPTRGHNPAVPTVNRTVVSLVHGTYLINTTPPVSTLGLNPRILEIPQTMTCDPFTQNLKFVANSSFKPTGFSPSTTAIPTWNQNLTYMYPLQQRPSTSEIKPENLTSAQIPVNDVQSGNRGNSTMLSSNVNLNICNSNKLRIFSNAKDGRPKTTNSGNTTKNKRQRKNTENKTNTQDKPKSEKRTKVTKIPHSQKTKKISKICKSQSPFTVTTMTKRKVIKNNTSNCSMGRAKKQKIVKISKSDSNINSSKDNTTSVHTFPYQKYTQIVQVIHTFDGKIKKRFRNVPVFFMCGTRHDLVTDSETDCPVKLLIHKLKFDVYCIMVDKLDPGSYLMNFDPRQKEISVPYNASSNNAETSQAENQNLSLVKVILSPYYYSLTSPMKGQHTILLNVFRDDPYDSEIFSSTTMDNIVSNIEYHDKEIQEETYKPCTDPIYDVIIKKLKETEQQEIEIKATEPRKRPEYKLRIKLFDKKKMKRKKPTKTQKNGATFRNK